MIEENQVEGQDGSRGFLRMEQKVACLNAEGKEPEERERKAM